MDNCNRLVIIAGENATFEFVINKNGKSFPLVDIEIQFKLAHFGDTTTVLTKTTDDFTITDNVAELTLPSLDTQNLIRGIYEYIVTFTDSAGNVDKQKGYNVEVIADIV